MSLLGALFGMPVLAAPSPQPHEEPPPPVKKPTGRRASAVYVDEYVNRSPGYRSRGKQARPRKRPNRLHISRRVRRAHRRSKAA
jgi:hypothetical protein